MHYEALLILNSNPAIRSPGAVIALKDMAGLQGFAPKYQGGSLPIYPTDDAKYVEPSLLPQADTIWISRYLPLNILATVPRSKSLPPRPR
jgi:hypothetical protein